MLLHLTECSAEPLHRQIARQLTDRIISGDLDDGSELVSARSLARRHHVSVQTVERAYSELADWGLIHAQGQGFFVQPLSQAQRQAILRQQALGEASPLNVVESMSKALSAVFDPQRLMAVVAETLQMALGVQGVDFVLLDDRTGDFRLMGGEGGFSVRPGDGVVQTLTTLRTPLTLSHLPLETLAGPLAAHLVKQKRSLAVPLHEGDQFIGFWALSLALSPATRRDAQGLLGVLAHQFVTALVTARFYVEALEKRRLEDELVMARQIQAGLLPENLPQAGPLIMAGLSVPSQHVGGDFYDVIPLEDGRYGVVIADVCGKGLPAAMQAAQIQTLVRSELRHEQDLSALLSLLNAEVRRSGQRDRFVTLWMGLLDPATGRLAYASAGHNPPLWANAQGSVQWLEGHGPALGLVADPQFQVRQVDLRSGDSVLWYTDGVTEAMDGELREYGEERLLQDFSALVPQEPEAILSALKANIDAFTGQKHGLHDDRTLLVVKKA